jgi:hypothetical protein
MKKPIPIIYIAGSSHSGSTVLDLMLGSHSAVESVGEAKKLPELLSQIAAGGHPLCTCKEKLEQCPLWGDLISSDLGDLARDAAANASLLGLILERQRKSVVLDSSKTLGRALLFARSDLFSPVFVHLVRDSRAVVFSSKRKISNQRSRGYGILEVARGWQKLNSRIPRRVCKHGRARFVYVRYEDLTDNPRSVLKRILDAAGLPWEESMIRFREHIHHNVEGNRTRMGSSSEIKRDEEYLHLLSVSEWTVATLLTWRGLLKFGYPLKRSRVAPLAGDVTPSLR